VKVRILLTGLFAFAVIAHCQQLPEPRLTFAGLPEYPPIARLAHVQGEVRVAFVLSPKGEPVSVTAISGQPLLKAAAEQNVKTWPFELPKDLYRTDWKYDTTFVYKISSDEQPYEHAKLTVKFDSFRHVELTTNPPFKQVREGLSSPGGRAAATVDHGGRLRGALAIGLLRDVSFVQGEGRTEWSSELEWQRIC
jgi:TonB family protein